MNSTNSSLSPSKDKLRLTRPKKKKKEHKKSKPFGGQPEHPGSTLTQADLYVSSR